MDPISIAVINNGFLAVIALCTMIGAVLSYRANQKMTKQGEDIQKLELNTNSMKDALIASTILASTAKGRQAGIAEERANPQVSAHVVKLESDEPVDVKVIPDKAIPVKVEK